MFFLYYYDNIILIIKIRTKVLTTLVAQSEIEIQHFYNCKKRLFSTLLCRHYDHIDD